MSKDWTYGEEGQKYPVQKGEVWALPGHIFICTDLMKSTLLEQYAEANPPTLLYCDPPWGQALLNGFRTKARAGKADHRWEDLYRTIADIGHRRGIPVYVEGSQESSRDGAQIPRTLAAVVAPHRAYWQIKYYRDYPSGLYYSGSKPSPRALDKILPDMDDDDAPGAVMAEYPKGTVIDPCAGMGATSRQAEIQGWTSLNNELNPRRVSVALSRLAKIVQAEPQLMEVI